MNSDILDFVSKYGASYPQPSNLDFSYYIIYNPQFRNELIKHEPHRAICRLRRSIPWVRI